MATNKERIRSAYEAAHKNAKKKPYKQGQSPYSEFGQTIRKEGQARKKQQETRSLNDYRLSHTPQEDINGYIAQNGLDREDAALKNKNPKAFNRKVGDTISRNLKQSAKKRGKSK